MVEFYTQWENFFQQSHSALHLYGTQLHARTQLPLYCSDVAMLTVTEHTNYETSQG